MGSQRRLKHFACCTCVCALSFLHIGCRSQSSVAHIPLAGKVLLKGSAAVNGTITLQPEAGTAGPAANAAVENGTYRFTTQNGPVAGAYVAIILLNNPSNSAQVPDKPPAMLVGPLSLRANKAKDIAPTIKTKPVTIPAPTTKQWKRNVQVPAQAPYTHDFELE